MNAGRSVVGVVVAGLLIWVAWVPIAAPALAGQPTRAARAHRRSRVTASFPKGPWRLGSRIHVTVRVHPGSRRTVRLERKQPGGHWHHAGRAVHTLKSGHGRLSWRATPAGVSWLRVAVSGTRTRAADVSGAVRRRIAGDFLRMKAPPRAAEGSVFTVTMGVTARGQTLHKTRLAVTAPDQGAQVKPPDKPTIGQKHHRGSVTLGTLRKGRSRSVRLRWRAPDKVTTLHFHVTLTAAGGVSESGKVAVRVLARAGGSFHFDSNLMFMRQAIGKPKRTDSGKLYADCTARTGAQQVVSFTDTLAAIGKVTKPGTSTTAWKKLALAATPQDADDVATVALAASQPLAALAAAIAGYRGSVPSEQTNYLNIAGASANVAGHPGWAIALETKAGSLPQAGSVGARTAAIRLTNLGHSYALMGQWSTAKSWLDRAVAADPSSSQVQAEAFAVDYCAGNKDAALTAYGKSIRANDTADEVDEKDDTYGTSLVNASRLMDISAGVQAGDYTMPVVPQSAADFGARVQDGYYTAQEQQVSAHLRALRKQLNELYDQVVANSTTIAERTRLTALMQNYTTDGEESVFAADENISAAQGNLWTAGNCHGQYSDVTWCEPLTGGGPGTCSEDDAIFTHWKENMQAFIDAETSYVNALWPVSTGVEANIQSPAARQYFDLAREAEVYFLLQLDYNEFQNSAGVPGCGGTSGSDPKNPTAPDAAAAACGSVASRLSLSVDVTDDTDPELPVGFSAKVNCQQLDFEIDLNALPFLSGFVDISTKSTGGVTFMVGAKAQSPLGLASFSSAFYITLDQSAKTPVDIGLDVGTDGEVAAKGVHIGLYSDHLHMSAINTFADPYRYY